jgi:type I restriction enzyme M protein
LIGRRNTTKNSLTENCQQDFEHLPPEQLVADILEKDRRVAEIMAEMKTILES